VIIDPQALSEVTVTTVAERDAMDDDMTDPRHPHAERTQPADIPRHLPVARKPVTKTALGGQVISVAGLGIPVWLHVPSAVLGFIVGVVVLCTWSGFPLRCPWPFVSLSLVFCLAIDPSRLTAWRRSLNRGVSRQ
jgi:hypothetical protein